jgi:hypothetical protein
MIKLGRIYGNKMIDAQLSNNKLRCKEVLKWLLKNSNRWKIGVPIAEKHKSVSSDVKIKPWNLTLQIYLKENTNL